MQTQDPSTKPPPFVLSAICPECPDCGKPMHPRAACVGDPIVYTCIVCAWRRPRKSSQSLAG